MPPLAGVLGNPDDVLGNDLLVGPQVQELGRAEVVDQGPLAPGRVRLNNQIKNSIRHRFHALPQRVTPSRAFERCAQS
eukprot:scaffold1166_cov261-Pinguiococcus_pyrenoidosus.AAC.51